MTVLDKKQIEQIKKIIENYFNAFVFKNLGPEHLNAEELAKLPSELIEEKNFQNAFIIGKHRGNTPGELSSKTYNDFLTEIFNREVGNTPLDLKSIELMKERIAHYLDNMKNRTVDHIVSTIHDKNYESHLENIDKVAPSLEAAFKQGDNIGELVRELRTKTGDIAKDWERVVRTELGNAHNRGSLNAIVERNNDVEVDDILVYKQGPLDGATCLVKGSKVLTSKGYKNVEDLNENDRITNINNIDNKQGGKDRYSTLEFKEIIKKECIEIELDDGSTIRCSNDHPVLIKFKNQYIYWEAGKLDLSLDIEIPDVRRLSTKERKRMNLHIKCSKVFRDKMACQDIWDFVQKYRTEICDEYTNGYSIQSIVGKYNLDGKNKKLIRIMLLLSGVEIKKHRHCIDNFFNKVYIDKIVEEKEKIIKTNESQIIKLYDNGNGISTVKISKKFRVCQKYISKILKKNGVNLNNYHHKGGKATWANMSEEEYKKRCEFAKINFINNVKTISQPQQKVFDMIKNYIDYDAEIEKNIDNKFRVDIFIPSLNTIVEYDGSGHYLQYKLGNKTKGQIKQSDYARDQYLKKQGYNILRVDAPKDGVPNIDYLEKSLKSLSESDHQFNKISVK